MKIYLRNLKEKDLDAYLYWNHPSREFHKYNGPYYTKRNERELVRYIEELRLSFANGEGNAFPNRKMIAESETDEIIGEVNWYWKSQETLWMEVGIVIFNENFWGKGIGKQALTLWIDELFLQKPGLVRIGLSTWSGNLRMIRLAGALGLRQEAVYRNARIVEGNYYNSLSFGILKEEWHALRAQGALAQPQTASEEKFSIPGVGGLVIRDCAGESCVLMQARAKADAPGESGLIEIPAGKIRAFESIFDALRREIREETGLRVTEILGEEAAPVYEAEDYRVINFAPFSCAQNLAGRYPIMVFVFLCRVEGELVHHSDEAQQFAWVPLSKLKEMLDAPARLYPMHINTLHKYVNFAEKQA